MAATAALSAMAAGDSTVAAVGPPAGWAPAATGETL